MIRDARVLRAGFVPREIEHRDAEVNHLSSVLEPITNDNPADAAVVTGPSGAAKTCIANVGSERRREEARLVESIYVTCWRDYSRSPRGRRTRRATGRSGGAIGRPTDRAAT